METFTNVWDAIEDPREKTAALKARKEVMRTLQRAVRSWNLSQKDAAQKLGLSQPRLSDLLRGKIDKFSLDALFDLLPRAGLAVSLLLR